jgi:hypothetical protein
LVSVIMLIVSTAFGQNIIEWKSDVKLQLADFQSSQSEINKELSVYSLYSGASMDFSFHMSSYEFMFTKNFNSKVKTTFNPLAAVIIAPDSVIANQLLRFGQYSFDLTELYVRKFRKELNDQKGAFSSVSFFQPIFNKLQEELNAENARVQKLTNLGENEVLLSQLSMGVLDEIEKLADWCYDCKPPKKEK